ncbi:hypothetical protein D3C86_2122490 [compost metagenome]
MEAFAVYTNDTSHRIPLPENVRNAEALQGGHFSPLSGVIPQHFVQIFASDAEAMAFAIDNGIICFNDDVPHLNMSLFV